MKRFIYYILLFTSHCFSQSDDELYYYYYAQKPVVTVPSLIACAELDLTTVPVVAYDDFCLQFTPPQFIKFNHQNMLDLNAATTGLLISWDMKQTGFTGVSYIFGQNHSSGSFKSLIEFSS